MEAAPVTIDAPAPRDTKFYRKRKKGRVQTVSFPILEHSVPDAHTHLHTMQDPSWELIRAAVHKVSFICAVTDLSEEGLVVFDNLDTWIHDAEKELVFLKEHGSEFDSSDVFSKASIPEIRIAVGIHPHNAIKFDDDMEKLLRDCLSDSRVSCLGEIGLDYHYDLSPREVQRRVFIKQLEIANEFQLPVQLHIREAHDEAFEILSEVGFPEYGCILHCCALSPDELSRWINAGCYISYGGVLTFNTSEEARLGAVTVPQTRLLTETDAQYLTPVPMRGMDNTPSHVIYAADCLSELFGIASENEKRQFYSLIEQNARTILNRPATSQQEAYIARPNIKGEK